MGKNFFCTFPNLYSSSKEAVVGPKQRYLQTLIMSLRMAGWDIQKQQEGRLDTQHYATLK